MGFSHVNIVARDADALVAFYEEVFGARRAGPPRRLHDAWLGEGMGSAGAQIDGWHLRFPGDGDDSATVEVFQFATPAPAEDRGGPVQRPGIMHFALTVDDIHATFDRLLAAGGSALGVITEATIDGVGRADFVYARDPEGNIVELQAWK